MSTTTKRVVGVILLLVVGAGLGLGIAAMVRDDGSGGDDAAGPVVTPETTTTVQRPDASTHPEAAELFDLVNAFAELTVHARYKVTVANNPDASQEIEIWQKEGKVRQEATVPQPGGGTGKVALLDLGDRVVLCQQPPGGVYSCGLVSDSQATAFDQLRDNLVGGLADQTVTVKERTIGKRSVRCFTVSSAGGELCADADGLLVRIASPEGSFELLEADDDVKDAVFTPPATPGATASA
jgi:hypothetical protein